MATSLVASFVHGYLDDRKPINQDELPALWVSDDIGSKVHNYPFPRNPEDFASLGDLLIGEMPLGNADSFRRLPRFGLTGLSETSDYLFAGSWNSVYRIRKSDWGLDGIISNSLMNDMHGIWADESSIVSVLTGKDTVVISDHDGEVIEHFTVKNDLSVVTEEAIEKFDWRFLTKQFRGATGLWHFNYVQRFGDEIWLTSRNLSSFIVVNLKSRKAYIRAMNQKTVVLLHDGLKYENEYYFTSIDGKILIAAEAESASFEIREKTSHIEQFNRDLVCELIRLDETAFGREPNWCRGIACKDDVIYVTVDGRYGSDLSFGVVGLKRSGEKVVERRLRWRDVGAEEDLKYVTGFDVAAI